MIVLTVCAFKASGSPVRIGASHHEVIELDVWRVLACRLMGNHYHLVVRTASTPLWRSMLRLQAQVAREFNRRRRYLGRFWQSRYRARVIDSQAYFEKAVAYVHLNPGSRHRR